MSPKALLRFASIVILLHMAGHTIGHSSWKATSDPVKQEVINQMFGHQFAFMGATRSMGEFYDGYGWFAAIALLATGVLLWIVSDSAAESPGVSRRILIVLCLFLFAIGIEELIYFFAFAASFSLLAAVLTGLSILKLRPGTKA
jgi:hypothetical protein